MEVRDSIEKRRSIRKFKDIPVEPAIIRQLIEAAAIQNLLQRIQRCGLERKMDEVLEYRGFGCVQEEGVKTS